MIHSGKNSSATTSIQTSSINQNTMRHQTSPRHPRYGLSMTSMASSQYFGLSGETDPYLIRHFRFASEGEAKFFKVHFRRVASELDDGKSKLVPAHFMISANELGDLTKQETTFRPQHSSGSLRAELDGLVDPKHGRRLIGLFLRFMYPSLPVISRTRLGITANDQLPETSSLTTIPTHLLAAIYAISIQFCHHDSVLCVSKVYTQSATDHLWKIALEEIMREVHTPRLSVLQAMLIYLQTPQMAQASAVADSPFRWSFLGAANSLTSTLGLHLDCWHWPIPEWEKRLRRRLWWIVFSETALRSLLLGFPNPIHDDQWSVGGLEAKDFIIGDQSTGEEIQAGSTNDTDEGHVAKYDFFYLAQLTLISSDIYWKFYTLKATKALAKDFHMSLNDARPLRARLTEWYSALPSQYKMRQDGTGAVPPRSQTAAYLRLSYLTLELFIYRALLRPVGGVVPLDASTSPPSNGLPDGTTDEALEAVLVAAESCGRFFIACTSNLTGRDLSSFWFPWTRICFSTMSNFTVTLLLQAPSRCHALEAKHLVDDWRETLRSHSQSFSLVRLGLLRLNAMHYVGLRNLSRASEWAAELIDEPERS